ncbi:MAG: DUF72 domain-containing protein, partial [Balneolaceae bacterium]
KNFVSCERKAMSIKKYHIGTTQWGLKEWAGSFYTKDAKPADFLKQYARVFNSVEGNTTFYRVPSEKTVKIWGDQVSKDFKFCFKFPQGITHYKRLKDVDDEVLEFLDLFSGIRSKLGPFHIQLSSQFSYSEMGKLEHLVEILPAHYHYAVEVRHQDYFDKGRKEHHLTDLLKSYGIDRVVFDTRRLHALKSNDPTVKEAQKKKPQTPVRFDTTGNHPFIRYVGANDILNNETYLKEWAIIVANWIRGGKHPYFFVHAPDTFNAPNLSRYFHKELSKLIDLEPMPAWPAEQQNEQLGLF